MALNLLKARPIIFDRDIVEGIVLKSSTPISPLGDIDPKTGKIIDPQSNIRGESVAGKILVAPYFRGSTVGSYILFALSKYNVAPRAIIVSRVDPMLVAGCVLGDIPLLEMKEYEDIPSGAAIVLRRAGDEVEVCVQ